MNPSSNLFLVGPMGAGKSTVGRRLARALELQFVDLDERIEAHAGARVALIFELEGEAGFRAREHDLLDHYSKRSGIVLASGGGCVLDPRNRALLAQRGFVLYLRASVEVQLERLARDRSRPLLRSPDRNARLRELALQRDPLYCEVADLTLEPERGGPGAMARRALTCLQACWTPLAPARFPEDSHAHP